jgi:hypothetical protein
MADARDFIHKYDKLRAKPSQEVKAQSMDRSAKFEGQAIKTPELMKVSEPSLKTEFKSDPVSKAPSFDQEYSAVKAAAAGVALSEAILPSVVAAAGVVAGRQAIKAGKAAKGLASDIEAERASKAGLSKLQDRGTARLAESNKLASTFGSDDVMMQRGMDRQAVERIGKIAKGQTMGNPKLMSNMGPKANPDYERSVNILKGNF